MPVCPGCETDHDVTELCRHEREGVVIVHCPDCNRPLGRYRDPAVR
jgi:hypothetical protein